MGSGEIARSLNRALESKSWSGLRAENRFPLFLNPLRVLGLTTGLTIHWSLTNGAAQLR